MEINQLKTKATIDIRGSLLKHVKQEIVNGLMITFNKSFEEGRFPEMLKIAKVITIFKRENPANTNRAISLLSVFDKLLEQVTYNRFYIQIFKIYTPKKGIRHRTTSNIII